MPRRRTNGRGAGASQLANLVAVTSRLFTRALHASLERHGVAPGQLAVLQCLWAGDGLTQAELARQVQVEQPTMARTLDRMARDGLIQRVPSKEDRRAFNVRLTARGKNRRRAVAGEAARLESLAASAIGKRERATLARLLGQLSTSLARATGRDAE
ncbi:MAG TPA: MarR family transcriptional regulator [Alphaproteobacteria bacterium]|nr:MarR family transcriptional regulator [Alphaproteobacteria bacterium]